MRTLKKTRKRKTVKRYNKKNIMKIKYHEIKGWRDATREANFNKLLLKAHRKGIKTIIVQDDEYADKKYNVSNQIKKRKLKKTLKRKRIRGGNQSLVSRLHNACQQGDLENLRNILWTMTARNQLHLINEADNGATPLFKACLECQNKVVEILLKYDNIDVNKSYNPQSGPQSGMGIMPFEIALQGAVVEAHSPAKVDNCIEVVKQLLKDGRANHEIPPEEFIAQRAAYIEARKRLENENILEQTKKLPTSPGVAG